MIRPAAALALAGLLLATPATARTMGQKFAAACAADLARVCPGAAPGSDAATACLRAHRDTLDAACARFVDAGE